MTKDAASQRVLAVLGDLVSELRAGGLTIKHASFSVNTANNLLHIGELTFHPAEPKCVQCGEALVIGRFQEYAKKKLVASSYDQIGYCKSGGCPNHMLPQVVPGSVEEEEDNEILCLDLGLCGTPTTQV